MLQFEQDVCTDEVKKGRKGRVENSEIILWFDEGFIIIIIIIIKNLACISDY
ncbi:hypothetical protein B7P43_G05771 [Cryptotermes secundus]|uniref:Uncharacterized protein n=1 Tax=Cryptotermes secundus TaxID=105785 RepID=A0A2J7RHI1_9NEOP|nr:hypothetical protein B7P43_G05771 [Cryptotermes secundus]